MTNTKTRRRAIGTAVILAATSGLTSFSALPAFAEDISWTGGTIGNGNEVQDALTIVDDRTKQNAADIAAINGRTTQNEAAITNLQGRTNQNEAAIGAIDGRTTQNEAAINNLEGRTTQNETAITGLDNRVTAVEGAVSGLTTAVAVQGDQIAALEKGTVKYTLDSNGDPTNEVALTGDGTGSPVTIKHVAAGVDETDVVNVSQLKEAVDLLTGGGPLSVQYVADADGKPTNTVALAGDGSGSPVKIQNVAAGTADTDGVNYGQIKNQVAYDTDASGARTNAITLAGNGGAPVTIGNLADGKGDRDAVNLRQLNGVRADAHAYTDTRVGELRNYTDARLASLSGTIRDVQWEARRGIATVMAASQLRYSDRPGVVSIAGGFGGFKGATSFAIGIGWTSQDLKWRVHGSVGVSMNGGDVAWGVGASYALN